MKKIILLYCFLLAAAGTLAQQAPVEKQNGGIPAAGNKFRFPQQQINSLTGNTAFKPGLLPARKTLGSDHSSSVVNILRSFAAGESLSFLSPDTLQSGDTIIVGYTPADTLFITGSWSHTGPVIVLNDGVVLFKNATITLAGDLFVIGNGKLIVDSSTLSFPQLYWYQRSVTVVQKGYLRFSNTTLNYGGFPHSLVVSDSAVVEMNNVTNADYTTTGLSKHASLMIDGNNLAGEFIITDKVTLQLQNVSHALLWHHIPAFATVNHSFPNGNTISSYSFNNTTPGVNGIDYLVSVSNSTDIQWALMPTTNSDVTISNSTLRSIGLWFEGNDTIPVSGLVNNSSYSGFTAPLADRTLHLINTSLQTWSIYPFDSVVINLSGCIVGEVAAFGKSKVDAGNTWVDGSGGYWSSSDSSLVAGVQSTVSTHVRSERNSIFLFAYSAQNNGYTSAIGNSLLMVIQCTVPQEPVAYEAGAVWFANLSQPATHFTDTLVPLTGSAFIDRGPASNWMDFGYYRMSYQFAGDSVWTDFTSSIPVEIRNGQLALWNTNGLNYGAYLVRLVLFDNWGDSVEAVKQIVLLPNILISAQEPQLASQLVTVFPNPFSDQCVLKTGSLLQQAIISIENALGQILRQFSYYPEHTYIIQREDLPNGLYLLKLTWNNQLILTKKLIVTSQ